MPTPPPEEPSITLYKYIKAEYLPDFLNTGYLKVSKIGEVNDPFEYAPRFDEEAACRSLIVEATGIPAEKVHFAISQETTKEIQMLWDNKAKKTNMRYISFSALCSSPLMWGHYADNHRGVCLVFQLKLKKLEDYFPDTKIARIIYSHERVSLLPLILAKSSEIKDVSRKLQQICSYTKAKSWEYEKEIRLFINPKKHLRERQGVKLYGDIRSALCGIILGVNYNDNTEEVKTKVANILKNAMLMIVQARQSFKEFRVENDCFSDITEEEYAAMADWMGMNFELEEYSNIGKTRADELIKIHQLK